MSSQDILDTLKCGRPEYSEETRNYETIITKNERLAIKEITRLRKENARLREALEPIVKIKAFTCIYEWTPVEALRDDEEVRVKLTGAQIKKMREAAIREGERE